VIPAAIAAIVILLIFVLEPFRIEVGPGDEASAEENSLAVMYFENMVDPEDADRTAQMITALLITDLSESQHIRVVSRQRLFDILKTLGKEDLKIIDKSVASEVARVAGVRWILTGAILRTEPSLLLTADISEAATGDIVDTQRVEGESEEDLFTVVDRLSAEIKTDLSLPSGRTGEADRPVASVTTHSADAYRCYLEGLDRSYRYNLPEAEDEFKKALEHDSTFAMAYFQLANIEWMQAGQRQRELIAQAVKYSGRVSERERYHILAQSAALSKDYAAALRNLEKVVERFPDDKEAFTSLSVIWNDYLERPDKAIEYLNRVIEIYPLYQMAYNNLAYAYSDAGDFERAIWAANEQIALAPDEPNPYDTQGDVYAVFGEREKAAESYKKALELEPGFSWSVAKLGHLHLFQQDYSAAESYYRKLCSDRHADVRSLGRHALAMIPARQGKFTETLDVLEQGLAADHMEQTRGTWTADKHFLAASVLQAQRKPRDASTHAEEGMKIWIATYPEESSAWSGYYAALLVENGEMNKAVELAHELRADLGRHDGIPERYYLLAMGRIELAKKDPGAAIPYLEQAASGAVHAPRMLHLWIPLATAYLEVGRLSEAVDLYERIFEMYGSRRLEHVIELVRSHYLLGLAYEQSGWNDKATEQYEEFLDIWKDADPGIAEVDDARERLARLKGSSS
jgi:tetratricopeptide (TPR) repeat protein/TolB-like protein